MAQNNDQIISDEEFARRLQQEEFGSIMPSQPSLPPSQPFYGKANVANVANMANVNVGNVQPIPNQNSSENISDPLLNDENNNPLLNNSANPRQADIDNNNRNNFVGNMVGGGNAAQRARRNVIGSVREADTESPRILLVRIVIGLLEVIATATVVSIGWDETSGSASDCNLLKYWVLVYSARHLITVPLRIHIYRMNRSNQNQDNGAVSQATEKSLQLLRWISIITFLWFLVGQTFLFTGKSCESDAPTIWYYCLVVIILVYVSLALPFLIVLAICICLPCVLIIFRFFAEPEGADDQVIRKLATRKFTVQRTDGNENENENETEETKNEDEDEDNDSQEAPSCAICMQDYKEGDELRILPCKHEFHTGCVDKWLPMKKICPLCRHDITKPMQTVQRANIQENNSINANEEDEEDEEEEAPPPYQSLVDSNHDNHDPSNGTHDHTNISGDIV